MDNMISRVLGVMVVSMFAVSAASASSVADTDLTTFMPNTAASASEVNDNFTALKDAVNDNDSRIDGLLNTPSSANGFLSLFDFGENAGTTSADGSGNANTLTLSTTGISWNSVGHTGSALNFDGVGGYAEAANASSLNPTVEITISAWVFISGTGPATASYCLVCKEGQYQLGINNGEVQFGVQTVSGPEMTWVGSGAVPLDTWVKVSGSYDGQAIRTYISDALTSYTTSANGVMATNTNVLRVGSAIDAGTDISFFAGIMDEVRIVSEVRNTQPGMSTLVTVVTELSDQRNGSSVSAASTWWDIPDRTLTFTKRYDNSRLKVTYQDTLGTLGRFYSGCLWQILLDDVQISFFSAADSDSATVVWHMSNAAHVAWASASSGEHTVKVQNMGSRGAWTTGSTHECLMGWNTNGNFLSVEEIP